MTIKELIGLPGKSKQIIVAKYNENVRWTQFIKNIPIIIYDKKNRSAKHYLPNIPTFPTEAFRGVTHAPSPTGRESHTYLYHIIKNYDFIADMNIFLQGRPQEIHCSCLDALRIFLERDFEGIDFIPLNFPVVISNKRGLPLHTGLPIERIYTRLFQGKCPSYFAYTWGAMFCVSKEIIYRKTLAFYEEMMQIIYDEPLSGYVYERLWPTILASDRFIPHEKFPLKNRASWQLPNLS